MDLVDLLHERLLAALLSRSRDSTHAPTITIGDVYQRLIPYRSVRDAVGVMELAEYEHALLRLLAGDGRHLELEDPAATLELQRELSSLNPILGIYRDYAGVGVRVGRGGTDATGSGPSTAAAPVRGATEEGRHAAVAPANADDPSTSRRRGSVAPPDASAAAAVQRTARGAERQDSALSAADGAGGRPWPTAGSTRPGMARTERMGSDGAAPARGLSICATCDRELPERQDLLFCPHCGVPNAPAPCARCGTMLEESWHFCIRCGTARRR